MQRDKRKLRGVRKSPLSWTGNLTILNVALHKINRLTRKHSNRMHTARLVTIVSGVGVNRVYLCLQRECPGGLCPGGLCPRGLCPGGLCPGGLCPGGLCPGGLCPGGVQGVCVCPGRVCDQEGVCVHGVCACRGGIHPLDPDVHPPGSRGTHTPSLQTQRHPPCW